jgi:hypothetical protein
MDPILRLIFMSYSSPETVRCPNVSSFHEQTDHTCTFLNGSKDMVTNKALEAGATISDSRKCEKYITSLLVEPNLGPRCAII